MISLGIRILQEGVVELFIQVTNPVMAPIGVLSCIYVDS